MTNLDEALAAWQRVFGLGLLLEPMIDDVDNSHMGILWAGNMPFLVMASTNAEGTLGRYLRRNGPSVQSLAWEVEDLWGTEHRLRAGGFSITGVHIEGRHFFLHPRDTFGLLVEFTDDRSPGGDPRLGDETPPTTPAIIPISGIARVTAVVPDLKQVVDQFALMFGIQPTAPGHRPSGADQTADFLIGDLTVRVVEPVDDGGPYAVSVASGSGRLHSLALTVTDFSSIDDDVNRAGLRVIARDDHSVWIDPDDMQGIRFELVR